MNQLTAALETVKRSQINPKDYPFVVVSFCDLRPCDIGARIVAMAEVNMLQNAGKPGCVLQWIDNAFFAAQSW